MIIISTKKGLFMAEYYNYYGIINDTKQNWINQIGYSQFELLVFQGRLKHAWR